MFIYKPTNKQFNNRKQIKQYLGGNNALNRAMRNKEIIIIYADTNN